MNLRELVIMLSSFMSQCVDESVHACV